MADFRDLRFIQRRPGGPKVLQYHDPSEPTGDKSGWHDVPVVIEWRDDETPEQPKTDD